MATVTPPIERRAPAPQRPGKTPLSPQGWTLEDLPRLLAFVPLMLLPWLFGGSDPSVEGLGLFWTAGTFAIWLLTVLLGGRRTPLLFPTVGLIVALGIGIGVCQFLPWPVAKMQQIAPGLMQLRNDLLPGDETSEFPLLKSGTVKNDWTEQALSPNPEETRHAVAILIWALASFLIGANLFSDPRWSSRLLVALAINGSLVAFFGIFQSLSWNGALYWTLDLTQGGSPFGPFVNRNNAGGFLNMTFGCVIASLAMAYSTRLRNLSTPASGRTKASRRAALRSQLHLFFADLNTPQLASFSMVLCVVTAILFTLSRGTIVAFLFAGMSFLWLTWRLPVNRIVLVLLVVIGIGGVWAADYAGVLDRWEIRIQEALEYTEKPDDRFLLWNDLLTASQISPWVGTGLGSFRYVMPLFHTRLVERMYYHAENQYLETLLELGIVGVTLLGLALVLMVVTLFSLCRRCANDLDGRIFPVFLAGCIALTSQMVGALFDFGLVIPSNMILLATLAGMMSGTWIWQRRGYSNLSNSYIRNLFRPAFPLLIAVAIGLAWSVKEERDAAAATLATHQAMYESFDAEGDENPYEGLTLEAIDRSKDVLEKVLARRPDDFEARNQLAQLWLLRYQMAAFEDLKQDRASLDLGDLPLWNLTDVSVVQMSASGFAEEGDAASLEKLRNEKTVQENLVPALRELIAARRASAWNADLELDLGWLSWVGRDPLLADAYTAKAGKLAPQFAQNFVDIGTINLNIGKLDAAAEAWKHAIELRPNTFDDIIYAADSRWEIAEMMQRVVPQHVNTLLELSRLCLSRTEDREIVQKQLAGMLEASLAKVPETEQSPQDKAMLARMKGNLEEAEQELSAAIKQDGKQLPPRQDRAEVLLELGRVDEAWDEITVCLKLQSRNTRTHQLETRIKQAMQKKKGSMFDKIETAPSEE